MKVNSPANIQIVESWNQGLDASEISEAFGYEVAYVLLVLNQEGCFTRKNLLKVEDGEAKLSKAQAIFEKHEEEIAVVLKDIALHGENESARVRAAIYAHEEVHGRNAARVRNLPRGTHINISELQIHMNQANEAVNRALGFSSGSKVIDIKEKAVA
jgi:hypothetical protein